MFIIKLEKFLLTTLDNACLGEGFEVNPGIAGTTFLTVYLFKRLFGKMSGMP